MGWVWVSNVWGLRKTSGGTAPFFLRQHAHNDMVGGSLRVIDVTSGFGEYQHRRLASTHKYSVPGAGVAPTAYRWCAHGTALCQNIVLLIMVT